MPALKTFCITFDRPNATYHPGETVTGNIIVELTKLKNIRGLYIRAKGEAYVEWKSDAKTAINRKLSPTKHYNFESYFNVEYHILGGRDCDVQIEIPAGQHLYPFAFQLPCNIPSSFEHENGHVRYTVKGVIDRPWRFDHQSKAAFTVISVLDLNAHHQHCLGIDDEATQDFCSFCCINKGALNLRIRVPSTGYVPGQVINAVFDYKNSSDIQMTKISAKLVQEVKLHGVTKSKTVYCVLKSTKISGSFSKAGQTVLELPIPPIPPSNLAFCKIIDLKYKLVIIAQVSGPHWGIYKGYPLLIGTIPLYCSPSAPPLDQITAQSDVSYSPNNQFPMNDIPESRYPIGFIHPGKADSSTADREIPPPSYEQCVSGARHIKEDDESNYVYGANVPFMPRYPVFNYPSPSIQNN